MKEDTGMDITQTFYDNLASQYDKLFLDWQAATREQAVILDRIFREQGFDHSARILDCACGIGTQAIGLAAIRSLAPISAKAHLLRQEKEHRKIMCRFPLSMRISAR